MYRPKDCCGSHIPHIQVANALTLACYLIVYRKSHWFNIKCAALLTNRSLEWLNADWQVQGRYGLMFQCIPWGRDNRWKVCWMIRGWFRNIEDCFPFSLKTKTWKITVSALKKVFVVFCNVPNIYTIITIWYGFMFNVDLDSRWNVCWMIRGWFRNIEDCFPFSLKTKMWKITVSACCVLQCAQYLYNY